MAIQGLGKDYEAFLWRGTEVINGGHCLVAWSQVQGPLSLSVWALEIHSSLVGRYGYGGCGSNVETQRVLGRPCPMLMIRRLRPSSTDRWTYNWATAAPRSSGSTIGLAALA